MTVDDYAKQRLVWLRVAIEEATRKSLEEARIILGPQPASTSPASPHEHGPVQSEDS